MHAESKIRNEKRGVIVLLNTDTRFLRRWKPGESKTGL
jgi:hypothetical protein